MTALKPIESARVVGVKDGQIKLLRKLVLNRECGRPDCGSDTHDPHHVFPRSLITNDSWWVEITLDDGTKQIIPHVIGLCRAHHDAVERHDAWIRLEDGVFNWYDRDSGWNSEGWTLLGPLTPQPGEVAHPKKRKRRSAAPDTDRRKAKWIRFRVPDDVSENGGNVLDELVQAAREEWAADMGWSEDVPAYYVVCAAIAKALQ